MKHATDDTLQALRAARERAGLSQRELSAKIGVPQSHISKIETGGSDLRLSSLVELARALDLDVMLVPRPLVPAVGVIIGNARSDSAVDVRRRSHVVGRARAAVSKLAHAQPNAPELERLDRTLREVSALSLEKSDLDTIRRAADKLEKMADGTTALTAIHRTSRQLSEVRNRIRQARSEPPSPAYSLADEDDDD